MFLSYPLLYVYNVGLVSVAVWFSFSGCSRRGPLEVNGPGFRRSDPTNSVKIPKGTQRTDPNQWKAIQRPCSFLIRPLTVVERRRWTRGGTESKLLIIAPTRQGRWSSWKADIFSVPTTTFNGLTYSSTESSFYIYNRPLTDISVIASVRALNLRIKILIYFAVLERWLLQLTETDSSFCWFTAKWPLFS